MQFGDIETNVCIRVKSIKGVAGWMAGDIEILQREKPEASLSGVLNNIDTEVHKVTIGDVDVYYANGQTVINRKRPTFNP